ncbi:MAG: hypothetical protein LC127_00130, partial [Chitinophagales bacterium]|nr:hypothetical protein [Chitinophagales bacterium]
MKKEFISFLSLLGFMVFSVGLFGQCQEAIALDHLPNGELLVCTSTPLPGNLNNGNVTIEYPDQVLGGTIPNYYYGGQEALYTYTPEADGPVSITVNNATWTAI